MEQPLTATRPPRAVSSRLQSRSSGVPVDAQESVAAYIASSAQRTADTATQPPAYSTKIVSRTQQRTIIGRRTSSITATVSSQRAASNTVSIATQKRYQQPATSNRSSSSSNRASSSSLTQTLTQPTTVSLTGPRQPPQRILTAHRPLQESTHSDTAEYLKESALNCHHRETIRMVWPADASLYDFSQHEHWDGQPIPIDDVDHVFDPLNYSTPNPLPPPLPQQQQLQYPTLEQSQVWSREEQATMDRLIEESMEEPFEGFDLDELDGLLAGEESRQQPSFEEEPLAEFFPMLGSSSSSIALPGSTPPHYHDMTAGTASGPSMFHQETTTTTTTMAATAYDEPLYGNTHGDWIRMGAADGRIDRSPTFMDTGCDLNVYLQDWYDEPSTSRSSPDYDVVPQQPLPYHQQQSHLAASTTTTTRTTTASVRYSPYAATTPRRTTTPAVKRPPVFRPEGFGTPAIGENVDEYRKRRDKNNVSSARSRAKKAEVLKEMKAEAVQLERKNIELKAVLDSLESEVSYYKKLMMTALAK